jgi:hypothetical protein
VPKSPRSQYDSALDRDLFSGLMPLYILNQAAEKPVFGLGMIDQLAQRG